MTSPVASLTTCRSIRAARSRRKPASPAELARRLIRDYRISPAIALLSDALKRAVEEPGRRLIITCPPRTGKTKLTSVALPVWALMENPDTEIILKSYGDSLGGESSAEARRLIAENTDLLGFELAADKQAAGRWKVAGGRRGGMLAGGIFAGTVGFGANLLILDDPIKSRIEADSETFRRRLWNEFHASLMTRLMPGGSVVIILTRWSELDLAGQLAASGPDWEVINIPAVSTAGVPDALRRERTGVPLTSANGFTADDFASIRRQLGEREWAAQYLGMPSTPEGGLIRTAWIEKWRVPLAPPSPVHTVVAIDPAESGQGDETGIVAMSRYADGTICLTADASGHMSSDQWSTTAVTLALTVGASSLIVEGFTAATTYVRIFKEALARARPDRHIVVKSWPPPGSDLRKSDAVARAAGLLQAMETGQCRLAGHHPEWEHQATSWENGQHQPDRVAAAVIGHDTLLRSAGQQIQFISPLDTARRAARGELGPPPAWMTRRIGGR